MNHIDRKFLCLILDRSSRTTIKEYPEVVAIDAYHALRMAANRYAEEIGSWSGDWYADCLEITEEE